VSARSVRWGGRYADLVAAFVEGARVLQDASADLSAVVKLENMAARAVRIRLRKFRHGRYMATAIDAP
jgi:hypothetical protein